jgi:hypothetical protein
MNNEKTGPEYAPGDVVEVFNLDGSLRWIEVKEVLSVNGSQVLKAIDSFYCACMVNLDSLASPEKAAR